ncbi:hypothetical protein BDV95DRAFT_507383, partial [Massariosphaeria phaeospora]
NRNVSEALNGAQTNQRTELTAVSRALEETSFTQDLFIRTDSLYTINATTVWKDTWRLKHFKGVKPLRVQNKDLID